MLKNLPEWVSIALVVGTLIAGSVIAFVHVQDQVAANNAGIGRVERTVHEVDEIVRDNQQRLAHIEALLNGSR